MLYSSFLPAVYFTRGTVRINMSTLLSIHSALSLPYCGPILLTCPFIGRTSKAEGRVAAHNASASKRQSRDQNLEICFQSTLQTLTDTSPNPGKARKAFSCPDLPQHLHQAETKRAWDSMNQEESGGDLSGHWAEVLWDLRS